ncbi:MAG: UDP-N-acetylmuramoyl-L-alanyl-D-glutamate--2,6-diaminopimelate ligase [candidate division Zixibacteria bacterium]|nr:UDP-N-acetylmuramoyl-L-alanyl-D-glutamate--2,6-diaminopimelate ligase [candidate division Zixibacteria bacterium]MDH3938995.1 UDP-N-acetylmuramoyl-L-alanyl-D-glutamate--2,6-diaminopimelate ligase [candidate division Zixibacteria bacterium]MDH4033784.1 UDP-N-acetylmuramoyl-L-alanyl-D-glutamate--2,6-diaminopimelate ligase [candidate division Zixibacteria bacterium]
MLEVDIKLGQLLSGLKQADLTGSGDIEIDNIAYDSRQATPNSLFVAISGFQVDGHEFIADAVERGAVAVVGEHDECELTPNYVKVPDTRRALADLAARLYDYPGKKIKACGVTGTNGKTTVCYLIRNILQARNKTVGMVTSTVYDTGKETFPAERTTPESLDLQRLLHLMKRNHCVNAVIEVSSHALALHRVDNIEFRVAVYTNITRDHLDFHKTMEEYLEIKKQLVKRLDGPLSYAVINLDVPEFRSFFGDFSSSYISYSLQDSSADVYCTGFELEAAQTVFDLKTPMGVHTVTFPLPGRFNLINGLAAAAAGLAAGVDIDSVVRGLESAQPVPGRFNYIECGQPFAVYVDFAHTPDALTRLCETAREMSQGRVLALFGCGGDRDRGKRPLMGRAVSAAADFCVVTSDNPRSEDPQTIIDEIVPGLEGDQHEIIEDRRAAIEALLKMAQPGDVVLLAGKGSENYQEIKGARYEFDDALEARRVLAELGYTGLVSDKGN